MNFNIPSNKTDIFLAMSPGTGAAILLYLLSKYIDENSMNIVIQPACEVPIDYEYHTIQRCTSIVNYVKNKFPDVNIVETRYIRKVFDHQLIPHRALKEKALEYQKENSINAIVMSGVTKVLELDYLEKIEKYHGTVFDKMRYMIDNAETLRSPNLGDWPTYHAFSEFTKTQIYDMYKAYDIQDLFDLTLSCDKYDGTECGTCFGCAEKSYLENN